MESSSSLYKLENVKVEISHGESGSDLREPLGRLTKKILQALLYLKTTSSDPVEERCCARELINSRRNDARHTKASQAEVGQILQLRTDRIALI